MKLESEWWVPTPSVSAETVPALKIQFGWAAAAFGDI